MDPRSAAHVLTQIAAHLELRGESRFTIRARSDDGVLAFARARHTGIRR